MSRRRKSLKRALIAAVAGTAVVASPAFADPVDPSVFRSDSPAATSPRHWSPPADLPAYPTPDVKEPKIQPGQPTWPVNPQVLTPPREQSVQGGGSDDDDGSWLIVGIGLAGAALVGGAGAARYARVRARRLAV